MLAGMTRPGMLEWARFHELEPFGPERDDLRAALIVTTLYNAWRGKGQKPIRVEDVFPTLRQGKRQRPKRQTAAQQQRFMMALTALFKGEIKRAGVSAHNPG
jgi:hypothetical protein